MTCALGAIRTILGTPARLNRQKGTLLHLRGVPIHAMDRRGTVHQFMEGEGVNFGDLGFRPIVTDCGGHSTHGTGVLVEVGGVTIMDVVGVADGLLMLMRSR